MGRWFVFFAFLFITGQIIMTSIEGGGFAVTRLNGDVNATVTTFTVDTTEGFLSASALHPGYFMCEKEVSSYTSKSDTQFLGVTRGVQDPQTLVQSEAATHPDNAHVKTLNVTAIDSFMGFNVATSTATFGVREGISLAWGATFGVFRNLPRMLAWDYPWFMGQLIYFRLVLFALSGGMIVTFSLYMKEMFSI